MSARTPEPWRLENPLPLSLSLTLALCACVLAAACCVAVQPKPAPKCDCVLGDPNARENPNYSDPADCAVHGKETE